MIKIPTFKMHPIAAFKFNDSHLVIIGTLEIEDEKMKITPCEVEVRLDDKFVKRITISAERMPGPKTPKGQRIVETYDSLGVDFALIREGRCMLIHF